MLKLLKPLFQVLRGVEIGQKNFKGGGGRGEGVNTNNTWSTCMLTIQFHMHKCQEQYMIHEYILADILVHSKDSKDLKGLGFQVLANHSYR